MDKELLDFLVVAGGIALSATISYIRQQMGDRKSSSKNAHKPVPDVFLATTSAPPAMPFLPGEDTAGRYETYRDTEADFEADTEPTAMTTVMDDSLRSDGKEESIDHIKSSPTGDTLQTETSRRKGLRLPSGISEWQRAFVMSEVFKTKY